MPETLLKKTKQPAKKKSLRSRFQSREAQLSQAMKITQTAQSPKGSLFTTRTTLQAYTENFTKTDMHYHLHLSLSLRDYPLNGSLTCPYGSSLPVRRV